MFEAGGGGLLDAVMDDAQSNKRLRGPATPQNADSQDDKMLLAAKGIKGICGRLRTNGAAVGRTMIAKEDI